MSLAVWIHSAQRQLIGVLCLDVRYAKYASCSSVRRSLSMTKTLGPFWDLDPPMSEGLKDV